MIVGIIVAGGLLCIALIVKMYLDDRRHPVMLNTKPLPLSVSFEPTLHIEAADLVNLLNVSYMEQLDFLVKEANVERKLPAFYGKYIALTKESKERYFQNLLDLLTKGKEEWLNNFCRNYPDISTQELLMMFLMDMGFDNRTAAEILMINLETLKKRKTRLRAKMKNLGIHFEGETLEGARRRCGRKESCKN